MPARILGAVRSIAMESDADRPRPWSSSSALALRGALAQLGYGVLWQDGVWSECLLWRDGESWLGRGPTREAALDSALALALPSHAARIAFEAWLGARIAAASPAVADADPAAAAADEARHATVDAAAPITADDAEGGASPDAPPIAAENGEAASAAIPDSTAVAAGATPFALEHATLDSTPTHRSDAPSRPRRPLDEITRELDALRLAAEQDVDELALASPERQRLQLLAWTARGRGLVDEARHAHTVDARMRSLAGWLGDLSKQLWPGSVTALSKDASPSDCATTLPHAKRLDDWFDVAESAQAELERVDLRDDQDGLDEYGYADAVELEPPSNHPEADLREIVATIERLSGTVLTATTRDVELPALFDGDGATLIRCAQHLRWLRGSAPFRSWGFAMGRLRWLERAVPRAVRSTLHELLDARHRPATSWATQLGQDPLKRRRIQRKNDLLSRRPRVESAASDASVADWLLEAFDAGDDMPSPKIAACLAGFESRIESVREHVLAGERNTRQNRRRMQKVVDCLTQPNSDVALARSELEALPPASEVAEMAAPPLETRLLEAVLPHTRGRRAVLVTNRNDPELDDVLRRTFEFTELDHVESKPSRIQGIAERIASATYDVVLVATGFQSHATDERLQPAARQADVLYVRVNRARRSACIHAIARELGLLGRVG